MPIMFQTKSYRKSLPPWKEIGVFLFALAFGLLAIDCQADTTITLNQPPGYTPAALVNGVKPTTTTSLYTAIDVIDNNILHLNQEFIYQAVMLNSISSALATITTQTANTATVDLTAVHTKLDAITSKLVTIEQKIDALGGDGMTDGDMVISGIMLALIFAVTWKG